MSKPARVVSWIAQVAVAGIFLQTLYFKFTYAPETQLIFADLGGRLAATVVGVFELIAAVLLLIPMTAAVGGLLGLGVIAGAIGSHLFVIGVAPEGDPSLFIMAVVVAVLCATVLCLRRGQLPIVGTKLVPPAAA